MEERQERLAQLEQFKMVEDDFVMIDPNMEGRKIEEAKPRLNRQIEEAIYKIKPEDYNEEGDLKEEAIPVGGEVIEHNIPEHMNASSKKNSPEVPIRAN